MFSQGSIFCLFPPPQGGGKEIKIGATGKGNQKRKQGKRKKGKKNGRRKKRKKGNREKYSRNTKFLPCHKLISFPYKTDIL